MSAQTCVFCRKPCKSTRDHVPPKGLWAKPRPHLITVPACTECNAGSNLDDEFMQRLSVTIDAEGNKDAAQVSRTVLRAISNPDAPGLRAGFFKTLTPVRLFTPSGLYAGKSFEMRMDGDRLGRILAKCIRGLWWHVHKEEMKKAGVRPFSESMVPRLPANYQTYSHRVGDAPQHETMRQNERNIGVLPPHSIGTTFSYRYLLYRDDPNLSVWGSLFTEFSASWATRSSRKGAAATWSASLTCRPSPPVELARQASGGGRGEKITHDFWRRGQAIPVRRHAPHPQAEGEEEAPHRAFAFCIR